MSEKVVERVVLRFVKGTENVPQVEEYPKRTFLITPKNNTEEHPKRTFKV